MKTYSIAVIPGDGIGIEVTPEGIKVLQAAADITGALSLDFEVFPWGSSYYLSHGEMMPKDGLKILEAFDAIYFGAVGFPTVPDHISLRGLRIAICQGFDLYVNLRPSILLPGIFSPLQRNKSGEIDFVVIRENTEGEYTGAGGTAHKSLPIEVAVETSIFTRQGIARVVRFAYDLAQKRPKKRLISATKSNALAHSFGLWDEIVEEISIDYPEVSTERVMVDALAARFVLKPETLDIVVASNLFADILTDIAAAICGSIGIAPSGNLNPERRFPSMFEPIHGSAPDIIGKGISNPIAMIWSGVLMLEFLDEPEAAELIFNAITTVTSERKVLTPDLGGVARTEDVGNEIVHKMQQKYS